MALKWLMAMLYDSFIMLGIFFVYTGFCLFITQQAIIPGTKWYQYSLIALTVAYYIFSLTKGGQTIGMRAWHLKIISPQTRISTSMALKRLLCALPAYLVAILSGKNPNDLLTDWTKTRLLLVEKHS